MVNFHSSPHQFLFFNEGLSLLSLHDLLIFECKILYQRCIDPAGTRYPAFAVQGSQLKVYSTTNRSQESSQRHYWLSLLKLHRDYSSQGGREVSGSEGGVWSLHCSRIEELSVLCKAFAEISQQQCVSPVLAVEESFKHA